MRVQDTALFKATSEQPVPGLPGATMTRPDASGKFQMRFDTRCSAQLFRLEPTPESIQAFAAWMQGVDRPGMLGPREFKPSANASIKRDHDNDPARLRQLQAALGRRGFAVQPTGTWDAATNAAVLRYKQARDLHEAFKTPDGKWALTPFVDDALFREISGR
jgi:hypothetical protein